MASSWLVPSSGNTETKKKIKKSQNKKQPQICVYWPLQKEKGNLELYVLFQAGHIGGVLWIYRAGQHWGTCRREKSQEAKIFQCPGSWWLVLGTLLPTTPICLFCAQNFRAAKTWVIFLKCFYKLQLHAIQQRIIITMCQVRPLFNFQNYLLSVYFWSHLHMEKTRS